MSQHADPARLGCPDHDSDGDGVYDARDQCPKVAAGMHPDSAKPGCPLPDRDGDSVVDAVDACPDRPGAPDPNPKKNGCPGLVVIRKGQIVILKSVFFANDKDEILKKSFPVMQAVANVLLTQPEITKVAVEGHTDDRGDIAHNTDLSERRAQACLRWLVNHSIIESRLSAKGYGPSRPIGDNGSLYGRAKNRRVEFHILESAGTVQSAVSSDGTEPAPAASPADGTTRSLPPPPAAGISVGVSAPAVEAAGKKSRKRRDKKLKGDDSSATAAGGDVGDEKPKKKRRTPK